MSTDIKSLLSDIRFSGDAPTRRTRLKLFQAYRKSESEYGWNAYPDFDFAPRFYPPNPKSELIILDSESIPLLRLAPGLASSGHDRPDQYRVLLVPSHLEGLANTVDGVSDCRSIPTGVDPDGLLEWLGEEFEHQTFERVLGFSTQPATAWLADVVRETIDHDHYEGIAMDGLSPAIRGGPAVYHYLRWELEKKNPDGPPTRHGAFEGLLVGSADHDPSIGLTPSDQALDSARDFRNGLRHPERPLVVFVPPAGGTEKEAVYWGQWANHLVSECRRDVVMFGHREKHEFHRQIDSNLKGLITFADRWLPTERHRAGLMSLAEGVVSGRLSASLMARRLDRPVVEVTAGSAVDVMGEGDVKIDRSSGNPDAVRMGRLYEAVVSGIESPGDVPDLSVTYDVELGHDRSWLVTRPTRSPEAELTPESLDQFTYQAFRYRLIYIINHFVGLELPDLSKQHVLGNFEARFGKQRGGKELPDRLDKIREVLRTLEQKLSSRVKGVDPSPPESMSRREARLFQVIEPLWRYRSVADGEEKNNQIAWGFRYFFNGCHRVLKYLDERI